MHALDSNLQQYNNTFHQIVEKVKVRGIKDYGMDGTMRKYAHELGWRKSWRVFLKASSYTRQQQNPQVPKN